MFDSWSLLVARCALRVARCELRVASCLLCVGCCFLVCCVWLVYRCSLFVVCLFVSSSFVVRCVLFVVCVRVALLLFVCMCFMPFSFSHPFFVMCTLKCVVCCFSFVVYGQMLYLLLNG